MGSGVGRRENAGPGYRFESSLIRLATTTLTLLASAGPWFPYLVTEFPDLDAPSQNIHVEPHMEQTRTTATLEIP